MKLGLATVVNVESSNIANFNASYLKNDPRIKKYEELFEKKLHIVSGVWVAF